MPTHTLLIFTRDVFQFHSSFEAWENSESRNISCHLNRNYNYLHCSSNLCFQFQKLICYNYISLLLISFTSHTYLVVVMVTSYVPSGTLDTRFWIKSPKRICALSELQVGKIRQLCLPNYAKTIIDIMWSKCSYLMNMV